MMILTVRYKKHISFYGFIFYQKLICCVCGELDKNKIRKRSKSEQWMRGATAGCAIAKCGRSFHLPCAQEQGILKRLKKAYRKDDTVEILYR